MQNALNSFTIALVDFDIQELGRRLHDQIRDVGRLHLLSIGDLQVFGQDPAHPPADVREATRYGTCFF